MWQLDELDREMTRVKTEKWQVEEEVHMEVEEMVGEISYLPRGVYFHMCDEEARMADHGCGGGEHSSTRRAWPPLGRSLRGRNWLQS